MAPDSLETDCPASSDDIRDPTEVAPGELMPSRPRSLFQIVCLEGSGQDHQPSVASL
jgi:hypothetical protein